MFHVLSLDMVLAEAQENSTCTASDQQGRKQPVHLLRQELTDVWRRIRTLREKEQLVIFALLCRELNMEADFKCWNQ